MPSSQAIAYIVMAAAAVVAAYATLLALARITRTYKAPAADLWLQALPTSTYQPWVGSRLLQGSRNSIGLTTAGDGTFTFPTTYPGGLVRVEFSVSCATGTLISRARRGVSKTGGVTDANGLPAPTANGGTYWKNDFWAAGNQTQTFALQHVMRVPAPGSQGPRGFVLPDFDLTSSSGSPAFAWARLLVTELTAAEMAAAGLS